MDKWLDALRTVDLNGERNLTMNETNAVAKDPICGMTVDKATAIHAERDGQSFCRQKFLSMAAGAKPEEKSGGCCG